MTIDRFSSQTRVQDSPVVDAGLQAQMRRVYNTMFMGLMLTAATAWSVANVPFLTDLVFGTPLRYVAIFGPLAFIFFGFSRKNVQTMPVARLRNMFYLFSALLGTSMAGIFLVYTSASIVSTFLASASMFAGASLYGYTTKKDLTGFGGFMIMGLIGLVVSTLITAVLSMTGVIAGYSPMANFVMSAIGVFIFTGLTAWETQAIKEQYNDGYGRLANERVAYMGALGLYMNFINLFQYMLYFTGQTRN
jgi:FtsH-binding integral membrane protein